MASVPGAAALASLSSSFLSKPSLSLIPIRTLPRLTCSLATSSSSQEFNITFAPPKPTPKPDSPELDPDALAGQLIIPWIVRGEDGNLKLQSHPPARFLQAIETKSKIAEKKKEGAEKCVPTAEPKYSKAARRFYNENFRDAEQRLSKVLQQLQTKIKEGQ